MPRCWTSASRSSPSRAGPLRSARGVADDRSEPSRASCMGTVGYLAPEQAAGQPADRRSDIFALGCVLYEMATGDRPFTGRSAAEMIAHVLHDEPRPVADVRAGVPPEFQRIVRRCLAKDPARRYQYADDLALDLRDLLAHPPVPASATSAVRPRGASRWLWPAAAGLVAAIGAWGWLRPQPAPSLQPPTRLALVVPNFGGSATAIQRQIAITPDGGRCCSPRSSMARPARCAWRFTTSRHRCCQVSFRSSATS